MKPLRVYADTSVIGGCLDASFAEHSMRLMDAARKGRIHLLLSQVVFDELLLAPPSVREILNGVPDDKIEKVELTEEILALSAAYLAHGILGIKSFDDATHIAAATVARADALVSWNFRHIVRLEKMRGFNQVNLTYGYGNLTILSPREVDFDEEE